MRCCAAPCHHFPTTVAERRVEAIAANCAAVGDVLRDGETVFVDATVGGKAFDGAKWSPDGNATLPSPSPAASAKKAQSPPGGAAATTTATKNHATKAAAGDDASATDDSGDDSDDGEYFDANAYVEDDDSGSGGKPAADSGSARSTADSDESSLSPDIQHEIASTLNAAGQLINSGKVKEVRWRYPQCPRLYACSLARTHAVVDVSTL